MMHETHFLRLTTEKQQAIWVNVSHITMITTTKKHLTALGILGQRECLVVREEPDAILALLARSKGI